MKKANNGGGFNEFYFTKSDGTTVAPKIAYSEKFEPWNWVITTGNYVDDMRSQVKDTSQAMNIVIRHRVNCRYHCHDDRGFSFQHFLNQTDFETDYCA